MSKEKKTISLPIKHKTRVDFIRTEVSLGNKDGEVVVKCTAKLQLEKFDIIFDKHVWENRFPFVSKNGVFTVIGRAVCGNESFNFDKGMHIAETRAQKKAYSIAERVYETIIEDLENTTAWFKFCKMNSNKCMKNAETHIKELDNND